VGTLNDRFIQDDGTPDALWLPWLAQQGIACLSPDLLFSHGNRLVVIAPHPDDEILACGGLLAMRAAAGVQSLVVAVTDGEASHGDVDDTARTKLGLLRASESNTGLLALGVAPASVVRLHVADGDVARWEQKIALQIQALLAPSDIVVTTWRLDGHPDHEAVARAAQLACSPNGCKLLQAPVWMWHWAEPGDTRVPWNNLVAVNLPAQAISAKQRALQCHQSQLAPRHADLDPVLIPSIVERSLRQHEYFFHQV
jgi:LmbE family N-acetylglucosaminyl deacetylase